ncbi:MAG TPA: DUF1015 domain-containing protein [Conexibacter sp.]|jgi:uncharacterized protein (DUF1015 family)|nr:DUF1015 domain-containing protein [Conexibacter sp.]
MAEILPLTALRYDLAQAGPLQHLLAPPYDVIDPELRAELAARSPYNVVHIDLPEAGARQGDRYAHAAATLDEWRRNTAVVQDETPAIWALAQECIGPDGRALTRQGFLCRVRIEDPTALDASIRPHERTHPGPTEDRLRLTRATKANLSPIFSLYDDPGRTAGGALQPHIRTSRPFGEATGEDGTTNRLWRITDPNAIATVIETVAGGELLIADGHHRYETARAYAQEIGDHEGPHQYVLMCLVALQDPGLTVFPTHRLVTGLEDDPDRQDALDAAIREHFDVEELPDEASLVPEPGAGDGLVQIGYMDAHAKRPYMLTLKDQGIADAALAGHAEPYRRLDTAVLEALVLKGALDMTDAQIDHLDGLDYARDLSQALGALHSGEHDAGFFMGATPVEQIQAVADAGEHMPPKSTYFFPKIPTGLVLNPLA